MDPNQHRNYYGRDQQQAPFHQYNHHSGPSLQSARLVPPMGAPMIGQQQQQQQSHLPADSSAPIKRRGTVACRRCRRLRTKCVHEKSSPPCEACIEAGVPEDCSFPKRGERDVDREFRRRPRPVTPVGGPTDTDVAMGMADFARPLAPAAKKQIDMNMKAYTGPRSPASPQIDISLGLPTPNMDMDEMLPPHEEVVEGCRIFVTSYFQLGFIPKAVFLEALITDPTSASKFLLSCILSISARFTPSLVKRYGSPTRATDHFLEVSKAMVPAEMYKPSLDRIQAFFLLAISQWGNGQRDRSSMDMGVAVRMASILKLHCEETYFVEQGSPTDQVVRSESARRVFWMIQSQENLHSGYKTPAPFPLEDITTLLPCDEGDFAFGAIPKERAAMAGTPPALADPSLVYSPRRCLFATLIQAHSLWGKVARRASRTDQVLSKSPPWDSQSEYQRSTAELQNWEANLPPKHAFSVWNLRGWKSESLHLAYLSVTMVLRLSNIVTRRVYLEDMLAQLSPAEGPQPLEPETPTMANANDRRNSSNSHPAPASMSGGGSGSQPSITQRYGNAPSDFWKNMSDELFENVWQLHEQIDAYFGMRSADEGFPQILVFCVYMCGSLSSYLWRYPALCPRLGEAGLAEKMAQKSLEVLSELHAAWPTSTGWQKGLQVIATPLNGVSPVTDKGTPGQGQLSQQQQQQQQQVFVHTPGTVKSDMSKPADTTPMLQPPPVLATGFQMAEQKPQEPEGMLGELFNVLPNGNQLSRLGSISMNTLPNELFDMEIAAFLQGDFYYSPGDAWQNGPTGWDDNRQPVGF